MKTLLILPFVIVLALLHFRDIFDSEFFKIRKLKKIVIFEFDTKTEFWYQTKISGTYLYIFVDGSRAYTISEFGNICGCRYL